jgi:hypothetical protein
VVRSFLADLPREVTATLEAGEAPPIAERGALAQLDAVFQACTPYVFKAGVLSVHTDPRWFSTMPQGGAGAPLLELRRWPGDTALTLYAVAGAIGEEGSGPPSMEGTRFELVEDVEGEYAEWHGTLETGAGERPAIWVQVAVPEAASHLGALLVPGDAGLGAVGVEDLTVELKAVLGRVVYDPEAWKKLVPPPAGEPLLPPLLGATPGDKTEEEEPWQVVRGTTFTMGLPPGFRARRTDAGVPPPQDLPGGSLWFRGRCTDMEETAVVVGDESRAGYVALVEPIPEGWSESRLPPLGAPGAKQAAAEPFPLIADRAGAAGASAERWTEEGFSGDWLLFRLFFEEHGVEIGLPVLEGRRSPSLYWIPATWRPGNKPPAPPPVDPAERFGIRFERLRPSERVDQPWTQGYLSVPGMRAEIPLGWFPAASLRSRDGYPVRFVDSSGGTRGSVIRLDAEGASRFAAGSDGWLESDHPGRHRAALELYRESGERLFVAREGHGFLFEPGDTTGDDARELWERLTESAQLLRSPRSRK